MEKFNELVTLLDELAEKYQFSDEDIARIQEVIFDVEGGEDLYDAEAAEYVEEPEDIEE